MIARRRVIRCRRGRYRAAAGHDNIGHYNFCRLHGSLPGTPAMAAGITGHPWTLEELLEEAGW